jgi:hypothetical protein
MLQTFAQPRNSNYCPATEAVHVCCALFRMLFSLVVWVLSLKLVVIEASIGDRSADFRRCVSRCEGERCGSELADPWLTALGWSCTENCRYDCMRSVTDDDVKFNRPIRQFYGKVCRVSLMEGRASSVKMNPSSFGARHCSLPHTC